MFTSTIASRKTPLLCIAAFIVLTSFIGYSQTPAPTKPDPLKALQWRSIGPYRAGRDDALAGVATQPMVLLRSNGWWRLEDNRWWHQLGGSPMVLFSALVQSERLRFRF